MAGQGGYFPLATDRHCVGKPNNGWKPTRITVDGLPRKSGGHTKRIIRHSATWSCSYNFTIPFDNHPEHDKNIRDWHTVARRFTDGRLQSAFRTRAFGQNPPEHRLNPCRRSWLWRYWGVRSGKNPHAIHRPSRP